MIDNLFTFNLGPRLEKKARKLLTDINQAAYEQIKTVGGIPFVFNGWNVVNPRAIAILKDLSIQFNGNINKSNLKWLESEAPLRLIEAKNARTIVS